MKLFIFSDSHGKPEKMLDAIARGHPDLILHLGDGERDVMKIEKQFPAIPLRAVRGNCDLSSRLPETVFFIADGIKVLMTHGHLFRVKSTLMPLAEEASARGADIVLFGHTHEPLRTRLRDIHVLNPGSCGQSFAPSYAELEITEKGELLTRTVRL